VSDIALAAADRSKDTLGRVYEYFSRFASARQDGGILHASHVCACCRGARPYKAASTTLLRLRRMFVQSEKFIEPRGKLGDISIYGRSPTTHCASPR